MYSFYLSPASTVSFFVVWTAQFATPALCLSVYALFRLRRGTGTSGDAVLHIAVYFSIRVGPNQSRCGLERGLVENRRGSPPLNSELFEEHVSACSDLSAMDLFNALSVIRSAAAPAVELAMNYELAVICN